MQCGAALSESLLERRCAVCTVSVAFEASCDGVDVERGACARFRQNNREPVSFRLPYERKPGDRPLVAAARKYTDPIVGTPISPHIDQLLRVEMARRRIGTRISYLPV